MIYYMGIDPAKKNSYDELYHFGIKGQKWGIRRYQNPDGTLTAEGKKRYGTVANLNKHREETKRRIKKGVKVAALTASAIGLGIYAHQIGLGKSILNLLADINISQISGENALINPFNGKKIATLNTYTKAYTLGQAVKDTIDSGKKAIDSVLDARIGGSVTNVTENLPFNKTWTHSYTSGGTTLRKIFSPK